MSLLFLLHVLAAVIWVGGMFTAVVALRPAAAELEPPVRLKLWAGVLARFFVWVWVAIVTLLVTGYAMVLWGLGGFAHVGLHVHLMNGLGILMMLGFFHVFFAPFKRLKRCLAASDIQGAARNMNRIRIIVTINLLLGLAVVAIASGGRYWTGA